MKRQATGLKRNSVVSCLVLATIDRDQVAQVRGTLSAVMRNGLNGCLKAPSPPRRPDTDSFETRIRRVQEIEVFIVSRQEDQPPELSAGLRDVSNKRRGAGLEPPVCFHLLRFSRPSQLTTLALLRLNSVDFRILRKYGEVLGR